MTEILIKRIIYTYKLVLILIKKIQITVIQFIILYGIEIW